MESTGIWFINPGNYLQKSSNAKRLSGLIAILDRIANKSKEHRYIVYQREVHHNVPLWVLVKALTFGQISKMYSLLQMPQQRQVVTAFTDLTIFQLSSILSCLTYFRNVCAHNERLYSFRLLQHNFPDTALHGRLHIPMNGEQYEMGKNDYFGVVISLRYLLRSEDFKTYKRQLKRIIAKYLKSGQRLSESELLQCMGFPSNWETFTRYRL